VANPPALVLPDGRPFVREQLGQEIARPTRASVRTIQSGHPAQGLTPERLARLLLSAEQGDAIAYYELAEEMEEKDLHYLALLRTRKLAVAQLPIEVEPAGDDAEAKEDAKLVKDWLDRDMLESELFDILDAIGKGVSATEIVWDMKPNAWLPRALKWRDPRWFEFDQETGEDLLLRGGAEGVGSPEPLPGGKFIVHFHPSKSGLPIRSGLARIAAWGYMFKNFAIKDWVTFLERYGHPIRIGKYGPAESEENKATLYRALYELGSDAAAAFPETMSVEFVDRKAGTAPNDLWRSHAEYIDLQLSKAVLGQTSTTDAVAGGIGNGQANSHSRVADTIERADAKLTAATLNRDLVPPLVMLNRGPREKYPRLKIGRPEAEDIKVTVETAATLASMGVKIDGNEMRERAGLPAAKSDESALKAPGQAVPANSPQDGTGAPPLSGAGKSPANDLLAPLKSTTGASPTDTPTLQSQQAGSGSQREPDPIALTTEEALGDWEALVTPMLDPVDFLIGDCSDLGELQSRLSETIEKMGTDAFTEALAKGLFAARVSGEAAKAGAT
jgi:phage gp29-like protein